LNGSDRIGPHVGEFLGTAAGVLLGCRPDA